MAERVVASNCEAASTRQLRIARRTRFRRNDGKPSREWAVLSNFTMLASVRPIPLVTTPYYYA